MGFWKSLLTWFVKSGAAEATSKAIVSKVTKKKEPVEK